MNKIDQLEYDLRSSTFRLDSPPTDPQTQAAELAHYLKQFTHARSPYVHDRPLTYVDGHSKLDWLSGAPDAADRDTYSEFWAGNHHGKDTWVALVSMPIRTWVANPDWDTDGWHAWGLALIKPQKGRGKHLIIWDCDPRSPLSNTGQPLRPQEFMLPTQVKLIKHAQKRGRLAGVWYNTDLSHAGQNRCLEFTLKWIDEMVRSGDSPFTENDPRLQGCTRITKK